MKTDRNYYETFEDAHIFAKKLISDFGIQSPQLGYDKSMPDCPYTVQFDMEAFRKAHPFQKRN